MVSVFIVIVGVLHTSCNNTTSNERTELFSIFQREFGTTFLLRALMFLDVRGSPLWVDLLTPLTLYLLITWGVTIGVSVVRSGHIFSHFYYF
jgi:hypothetical protein